MWGCQDIESASHLFFQCLLAIAVWKGIFTWLNLSGIWEADPRVNLRMFGLQMRGKAKGKLRHVIWGIVVWSLWANRNYFIFQEAGQEADFIIEQIKFKAWLWICRRKITLSNPAWDVWKIDPSSGLAPAVPGARSGET